jgi:NAD(P)-dependent dehydrogenase (short-subunit alcohol dehydrogenase family)
MTTVGIATGAGRGMGRACAERLSTMVDHLLIVDLDEKTLSQAEQDLTKAGSAGIEAFLLDVTDQAGVDRLAARSSELGTLRAVAHAAGISPTMADWRRVITVDLRGTAMLIEALRPAVTAGTAFVCFASMAPWMAFGFGEVDPKADAALDGPLDDGMLDQLQVVLGSSIEDSGAAYSWAKRGVQRLVQREAVRLGSAGARICSVSPGIIDTPQGRQEAQTHAVMKELVARTPLAREGRAEEVAAVVAFLLSDEASFVNGVDILVDGGVVAALRTGGGVQ